MALVKPHNVSELWFLYLYIGLCLRGERLSIWFPVLKLFVSLNLPEIICVHRQDSLWPVYEFCRASVTKYDKLSRLNRNVLSHNSRGKKSEIKVLAGWLLLRAVIESALCFFSCFWWFVGNLWPYLAYTALSSCSYGVFLSVSMCKFVFFIRLLVLIEEVIYFSINSS